MTSLTVDRALAPEPNRQDMVGVVVGDPEVHEARAAQQAVVHRLKALRYGPRNLMLMAGAAVVGAIGCGAVLMAPAVVLTLLGVGGAGVLGAIGVAVYKETLQDTLRTASAPWKRPAQVARAVLPQHDSMTGEDLRAWDGPERELEDDDNSTSGWLVYQSVTSSRVRAQRALNSIDLGRGDRAANWLSTLLAVDYPIVPLRAAMLSRPATVARIAKAMNRDSVLSKMTAERKEQTQLLLGEMAAWMVRRHAAAAAEMRSGYAEAVEALWETLSRTGRVRLMELLDASNDRDLLAPFPAAVDAAGGVPKAQADVLVVPAPARPAVAAAAPRDGWDDPFLNAFAERWTAARRSGKPDDYEAAARLMVAHMVQEGVPLRPLEAVHLVAAAAPAPPTEDTDLPERVTVAPISCSDLAARLATDNTDRLDAPARSGRGAGPR